MWLRCLERKDPRVAGDPTTDWLAGLVGIAADVIQVSTSRRLSRDMCMIWGGWKVGMMLGWWSMPVSTRTRRRRFQSVYSSLA